MARDLRSKKMPEKPSNVAEADAELALDLPADDEELGAEEAELDLADPALEEPEMDEKALFDMMQDISDDDLLAEVKARGLSLEDAPEAEEDMEAEEEVLPEAEEEEI